MIAQITLALALALTVTSAAPVPSTETFMDHDVVPAETPAYDYYDGPVLTRENGVVEGPSGKETYYNLDMSGVIAIMREAGFDEEAWPYWVREDGCKMLGDYIMLAADQSIRPLGSIVATSRGWGIVCDTGDFIYENPWQLDLAVSW